jgi:hypothetical protein
MFETTNQISYKPLFVLILQPQPHPHGNATPDPMGHPVEALEKPRATLQWTNNLQVL